ncbi:MAG: hypothetical protein LUD72_10955 [Bacteroidales bacterium]|nr:hypothetical protein [Bacteroidales bacterium]
MTGCILAVLLTVFPTDGTFLTQLQERDSVLIADQLLYGFELKNVEPGTQFLFPEIKQEENAEGPIVLSGWQIDTLKVYRAKKNRPASYDMRARLLVTSFEEGEYMLPPLATMRIHPSGDIDTLVFEGLPLTVCTLPIDTDTFELNDIKSQIRYPLTFKELIPYIIGYWLIATIIILVIYLILLYRKKVSGELAFGEPAHITALRKIDRWRGDKFWAADKQKAFYSGVTDALREYIVARYGVSAMEMTTSEIFEDLKTCEMPPELYNELEALFKRADFVKFAKYIADREENAAVVPLAVRFVTTTYQTEVEEEAAEEAAPTDGTTTQEETPTEGPVEETPSTRADGLPEEHSKWLPNGNK